MRIISKDKWKLVVMMSAELNDIVMTSDVKTPFKMDLQFLLDLFGHLWKAMPKDRILHSAPLSTPLSGRRNSYFTSTGNIKKNIFLSSFCWQLLYQDDEPQIRYSYLLPKDYPNIQYQREQQQPAEPVPLGHRGVQAQPTQPTPNRQTYAWRLIGFTQCTHSCAGGTWFNSSLFFVVGGSATDFVTSFSF